MQIKPPDKNLTMEAETDSQAGSESSNFIRLDEIEHAKKRVKMAVHRILAWLVPCSVALAFLLFWIGVGIYSIHMATPYSWLTPEQVQELRTILFSSVLGAVVSQGIKHYLA